MNSTYTLTYSYIHTYMLFVLVVVTTNLFIFFEKYDDADGIVGI